MNNYTAKSKKAITFVIGSLDIGGTEKHLLWLVSGLLAHNFKVTVISLASHGQLFNNFNSLDISFIYPKYSVLFRQALPRKCHKFFVIFIFLLRHIFAHRSTLIHFFLPASYILASPLAIIFGSKSLIMSRRSRNLYQQKYFLLKYVEEFLHKYMSLILVNSTRVKVDLLHEGVSSQRIKVIYNGVDTSLFSFSLKRRFLLRSRLGISHSSPVFVTVANFKPYKGHKFLLDAFARFCTTHNLSKPYLIFVGRDDGIQHTLYQKACEMGIADQVIFLDSNQDIPPILSCSDIYISPSLEEGFSNSILEAMSVGLPIVATDVGGNPEAVQNGVNGIIVPPRCSNSIYDAMTTITADPNIYQNMSSYSRRFAVEKYSTYQCLSSYLSVYNSIFDPTQKICL